MEALPLFAPLDIRLPAPAAPGSKSSQAAADSLSIGYLQQEQENVLRWFVAQREPRTRHECGADLYKDKDCAVSSACGRVNVLITLGYLEEVGMQGKRATIRATAKGCRRFARTEAA